MSRDAERNLAVPTSAEGYAGVVGDDRPRTVPKVSENARSRQFVETRNRSVDDYARFAAAAGVDIFNGEPLEAFAEVGKHDDRLLRAQALELRRQLLAAEMEGRSDR